jgi:ArsR family transcriptional regulator
MSIRIYKNTKETGLDLFFRALADRTRLRLLNLMRDHEVCVCYFVEILKMSQPKVSRHLAYLRRAGIAAARRQGTWMHYRIVIPRDARIARLLREVLEAIHGNREMLQDRARLDRARCAPDTFVTLQSAPPPAPIVRA